MKASQKEVTDEIEDRDEQEAVATTYDGLDAAMEKGKEKYDDFNEVVLNEDLIISPELTQIFLDTDSPEDIMYYLASNPEEAARISGLDILRVAKEVGKIEVKLASGVGGDEDEDDAEDEAEVKVETPPKKQSSAPAPITPVKTTGVTTKDPNKMSPKEYRAWREKKK